MMKKEKGITLVALIITIIVIAIIASTTIYLSMDRFEINDVKKMYNDLELLEDKVENYYFKYGKLPILRDENNEGIKYTYTPLMFEKDIRDNINYYILDLAAIGNLTLNYGEEVLKKQGETDDVYIINEISNTIYYVRGIEKEGVKYHYINKETPVVKDDIPPTKPQIKLVSGAEKTSESGFYTTEVVIDIIAGKNNTSGIEKTEYTKDGGVTWIEFTEGNKVLNLDTNGIYNIKAKTYAKNGLVSEEVSLKEIEVHKEHDWNIDIVKPTCTVDGKSTYTCKNTKCGETYSWIETALGHKKQRSYKAMTCLSDGYDKEWCPVCGEIFKDEIMKAPGEHDLRTKYDPEYSDDDLDRRPKYVHMHKKTEYCVRGNCSYVESKYEWHNASTEDGETFDSKSQFEWDASTSTYFYDAEAFTDYPEEEYMCFSCRCTKDYLQEYELRFHFRCQVLGTENKVTGKKRERPLYVMYATTDQNNEVKFRYWNRWYCFSQEEALEVWKSVGYTEECLEPGYCAEHECAHKRVAWDYPDEYIVYRGTSPTNSYSGNLATIEIGRDPNMTYDEWLESQKD